MAGTTLREDGASSQLHAAATSISEAQTQEKPRVAFISGHIDLTSSTFATHYHPALDAAAAAGHAFVLSNAGGADTLALEYLLAQGVSASRITVYQHTPPARRQGRSNATMRQVDTARTGELTRRRYDQMGLKSVTVAGWHTERDAAMTQDSDYDILWVRPEEETRALYGPKYRAGRISGTEKNRRRRAEQRTQAQGALK